MKTQQIISTRPATSEGACACGADTNLFVVEYADEYGDLTGDYPSLLQCQRCLSNSRADAEYYSHH